MSKIIVDKTHNSSSNLSLVSTNRYPDTVIKLLLKLKIQITDNQTKQNDFCRLHCSPFLAYYLEKR